MKTIKNGGDGMTNSVDKIQKLLSSVRNALQVSKQRPIFKVERHSESIFPAWLCVVLKFNKMAAENSN